MIQPKILPEKNYEDHRVEPFTTWYQYNMAMILLPYLNWIQQLCKEGIRWYQGIYDNMISIDSAVIKEKTKQNKTKTKQKDKGMGCWKRNSHIIGL